MFYSVKSYSLNSIVLKANLGNKASWFSCYTATPLNSWADCMCLLGYCTRIGKCTVCACVLFSPLNSTRESFSSRTDLQSLPRLHGGKHFEQAFHEILPQNSIKRRAIICCQLYSINNLYSFDQVREITLHCSYASTLCVVREGRTIIYPGKITSHAGLCSPWLN